MRRLLKSLFKKKSKEDIFESELCYSCNSSLPIKSKFNIYKCKSCNTLNFKAFSIANIQLEEFISYGGSGAVFKSGDKAIKLVYKKDWQALKELHNEYDVFTSLKEIDKHLLPLEAFFENDIYAGLITPYEKGGTLAQYVETNGPMDFRKGLEIILQVTDALQCLYKNGFLYPDIKPQNILISASGDIQLCDYGHVSSLHSIEEDKDNISGTADFISPERLTGVKEDCRSSLYSVGLLIHYIFTAKKLYIAESLQETAEKHVKNNAASFMKVELKHLPVNFIKLVERLTDQDRNVRLGSFPEFKGLIRKQLTATPQ
ncbi:serine:threonine protein kinase [Lentisphaera araneosa HTCC2155]|jgi:serine/threonine protein kinase|uniref:Serine:threonine protein kinase n=1 Tax=Lentisphaera araneosa HTCC2155 TaxID=313628 RepID=A6DFY4_9BACT|nr:protein kinase [Lentisphaera araneosa]EDM29714.1 serine:threonine protein kinase [Lentisphaera araneosa HTCC2155]